MKTIILDAKRDTPWVLRYQHVLCLDDLEFSLVACPSYAAPIEFLNRWLMLFRECFWTAELQSAVLLPVLRECLQGDRPAALADVVDRIRLRDKSPAGKAAADRLESIGLVYPKLYASRANRWSDLHEVSLYCPISGALTPAIRFATWLPIIERFAYLQYRQHRVGVHTVVVLDEAQTSLSKRTQTISGLPSTPVQLLPTTREHGLQFIVATPSWTELDPLVLSQFQVQIALQPSDGRELEAITKSFRLTPAQTRFTSGMQRGTGIGTIRGIGQPFLFTYPPFPITKDIDDCTRRAARARAERFCAMASNADAPTADDAVPLRPAATRAPAPQAAVAPAVPQPIASNDALALNTRERKVLTYIAQCGIVLVIELLRELHLQAMQESRTRKNLRAFGLIEEHRIVVRSGRGGSAVALIATRKAHDILRLPRAHLGKGGPQHQYFLRELRDLLGATLEVRDADAVLTIAPNNTHERLGQFLGIALNAGDSIALEVECSNPRSTAPVNVTRDHAFAHTVIAVLPKHVASLRARFRSARVSVVDVLALLAALRLTEPA